MSLNARDTEFFMRYHNDKVTEVKEGVVSVLQASGVQTEEQILTKLPENARDYLLEQPRVLGVVLSRLEQDGQLVVSTRIRAKEYRLKTPEEFADE